MTIPTIGSANIHPLSREFFAYIEKMRREIVQDVLRALKHPSRLDAEAHDKRTLNEKLADAGWSAVEFVRPSLTIADDKATMSAGPIIISAGEVKAEPIITDGEIGAGPIATDEASEQPEAEKHRWRIFLTLTVRGARIERTTDSDGLFTWEDMERTATGWLEAAKATGWLSVGGVWHRLEDLDCIQIAWIDEVLQ